MKNTWMQSLEDAGRPLLRQNQPDGGTLLISPWGGRVLGLFVPGCEKNLLWVNPDLDDPLKAEKLLASPLWPNLGGDRIWLAPERDFFYPGFPDLQRYEPPTQIDPGQYSVDRTETTTRLVNIARLHSFRLGVSISLKVTRVISSAPNPLRHEKELMRGLEDVRYAGYHAATRLTLRGQSGAAVQGWACGVSCNCPTTARYCCQPTGIAALEPILGKLLPRT